MQLTGQAPEHSPQSVHLAAAITYLPSFSEIASKLQVDAQTPQPTHCSLSIANAITSPVIFSATADLLNSLTNN